MAVSAYRSAHARRGPLRSRSFATIDTRARIGFVSTFPPTKCGLATFTASLAGALARTGRIGVVSCVDAPGETRSAPRRSSPSGCAARAPSLAEAVDALDGFDAVIVQHEFGIFGGQDGEEILELVEQLTVPRDRRPAHRPRGAVAEPAADRRASSPTRADRVVVQSEVARERLLETHTIDASRVSVIQHGATANIAAAPPPGEPGRRPVVLTWGLLGPGKGIEYAIEALALLRDLDPPPRYVVLGQTHPNIVRALRRGLPRVAAGARGRARRRPPGRVRRRLPRHGGDPRRDPRAPTSSCCRTSRATRSSRACSSRRSPPAKPVVSTAFPHAVELLAGGSGIVVPHEDPPRSPRRSGRSSPTRAAAARRRGGRARRRRRRSPGRTSGVEYAELASGGAAAHGRSPARPPQLRAPRCADRRGRRSSSTRCYREPRLEHGYCTDDVARALVVVCREPDRAASSSGSRRSTSASSSTRSFPTAASTTGARPDRRLWTTRSGSDDSQGRALFGLGVAAAVRPSGGGSRARAVRARRAPSGVALAARECVRARRRVARARPGHARRRSCSSGRPTARRASARPGLAVAGGSPRLRQRAARRGADRRRRRAGDPARRRGRRAARAGSSRPRRATVTSASRRSAAGRRASRGRASTSSRSRQARWPTRAPAPSTSTGDERVRRARAASPRVVPRRERHRRRAPRPGDRRRLRRPRARRAQREPGRRVDARRDRRVSGGRAERAEQLARRDGRGADAAVGRAVGQVDRPVGPRDRALHEHDVVDVALPLPSSSGAMIGSASIDRHRARLVVEQRHLRAVVLVRRRARGRGAAARRRWRPAARRRRRRATSSSGPDDRVPVERRPCARPSTRPAGRTSSSSESKSASCMFG